MLCAGSLLLSGSDDGDLCVWDVPRRKLTQRIATGHDLNIFCTNFLPSTGNCITSTCAGDATVRIHDLTRSTTIQTYEKHTDRVKKLVTDPDNSQLVISCSEDGSGTPGCPLACCAVLWHVLRCCAVLGGPSSAARCCWSRTDQHCNLSMHVAIVPAWHACGSTQLPPRACMPPTMTFTQCPTGLLWNSACRLGMPSGPLTS
jgi:hypothetical protein